MTWAKPAARVKQWDGDTMPSQAPRVELRIADTRARLTISLPKQAPKRSETYRRWVASRPCAHCGRPGPSQCAHGDEGKGMGIKSSDETCFALCPPCHAGIGSQGWFKKEHRRTLERTYGYDTKIQAISDGRWPKEWNE